MRSVRVIGIPVLVAALLAVSVASFMARGALAADGQLCSVATGPTVVLASDGLPLFDADGDPVMMDAPVCPDVILKAMHLTPAVATVAMDARLADHLATSRHAAIWADQWRMGGQGRGPPHAA